MKLLNTKVSFLILGLFILHGCILGDKKNEDVSVVQNGVGVVQNGVGNIGAEDMGTVLYDSVSFAMSQPEQQQSNSNAQLMPGQHAAVNLPAGKHTVAGPSGGSLTIETLANGKVKIIFKDFQLRAAYPKFQSGEIISDLEIGKNSAKGSLVSDELKLKEQSMSFAVEYDLEADQKGYLQGQMKGSIQVGGTAYKIEQSYDTPIILVLETNQSKYEPGQIFQLRFIISTNSPPETIRFSAVNAKGEKIENAEEDLNEEGFDAVADSLYLSQGQFEIADDVPIGKARVFDVSITNEAGARSNSWPELAVEVVPEGSGVEQQFLQSLEELYPDLFAQQTALASYPEDEEEYIEELEQQALADYRVQICEFHYNPDCIIEEQQLGRLSFILAWEHDAHSPWIHIFDHDLRGSAFESVAENIELEHGADLSSIFSAQSNYAMIERGWNHDTEFTIIDINTKQITSLSLEEAAQSLEKPEEGEIELSFVNVSWSPAQAATLDIIQNYPQEIRGQLNVTTLFQND